MTKRSVRADIDELNEDVLGDLTPDQRTELYHEAVAAGREEWVETLRKTCDWRRYRAMEMAYTDRIEASFQLLQATLYELHTTVLHYQLSRERQHRQWATDWEREEEEEEEPPAARVEAAVERADQIQCFLSNSMPTIMQHSGSRPRSWVLTCERGWRHARRVRLSSSWSNRS